MFNKNKFKIFDAHLHTYGIFLRQKEDVIDYMDRFNVEKAIITTINRAKLHEKQKQNASKVEQVNKIQRFMDNFKKSLPEGQLSHQDVMDIANKAPDRFFKFFWFFPKVKPEEEEKNYKILEEHFKKGFCGVKIHSAYSLIKIPKDIIKLVSFMQDYDKNLILFIHSMPKTAFFSGVSSKNIATLAKK
ncbi:unnamed protein product, partial [marine sediment metagenome]